MATKKKTTKRKSNTNTRNTRTASNRSCRPAPKRKKRRGTIAKKVVAITVSIVTATALFFGITTVVDYCRGKSAFPWTSWTKRDEVHEDKNYKITFDVNGGVLDGNPTVKTQDDGTLAELPAPTREGGEGENVIYRFDGWYTLPTGGEKITTEFVFGGDTTVYAHWIEDIIGGGTTGGDDNKPEEPDDPNHSGNPNKPADPNKPDDNNPDNPDTPEEPENNVYTVTFEGNGGEVKGSASVQTQINGKLKELPKATREGYRFLGWYLSTNGGTAVTAEYKFLKDTTLYARWVEVEKRFTITFIYVSEQPDLVLETDTEGRLTELPEEPTKAGYTFDGWFTEISEGEQVTAGYVFDSNKFVWRIGLK